MVSRRSFLTAAAASVAAAAVVRPSVGAAQSSANKQFAKLPLRMGVQPGFFEGTMAEQMQAIADWGFPGYEYMWPDADKVAESRALAEKLGLESTCIGGVGAIAPGNMVDKSKHDDMEKMFRKNVQMAKDINTKRLIGLSGNTDPNKSIDEQTENVVICLKRLAPIAEENGVTIIMEALNPLVDHKGYFLTRTDQTMDILEKVGSPNVKMLFDIYHQQITEGNVIRNLSQNIDRIGHFHVADNPGRKQPGSGELNYTNIFKAIVATKYDGFVSLECGKTGTVDEALNSVLSFFDEVKA
ncbi:MAG: TIM barrel protein [Candidatus Hydrogenedentales bacterium]|jgi:hydroxypyruvate isomerase